MGFAIATFTIPLGFGAGHPAVLLLRVIPGLRLVLLYLIHQVVDIRILFFENLLSYFPHGVVRIADKKMNDEFRCCHFLKFNHFEGFDELVDEI